MKKIANQKKISFFKRKFIQLCRKLGYEIIDQNLFIIPTLNKNLDESLSIPGDKSISIPLGEIKITRKVTSLHIYFRSCSKTHLWKQNKKRIFDQPKYEYVLRSLNSLLKSMSVAKKIMSNVDFNITVIDDNSEESVIEKIKILLEKHNFKNSLIKLDSVEFSDKTQDSNFASIYKSYLLANDESKDLIYFVEDDYIHENTAIKEMLLSYERIASQLNKEIIMFSVDYPYLYAQPSSTFILLGDKKHWRKIDQSLATLLISKKHFKKYWNNFLEFATTVNNPAEKPLHTVYEKEDCFSPIPSLAVHCTNVNSIYGLSPNMNWKKLWDENGDY